MPYDDHGRCTELVVHIAVPRTEEFFGYKIPLGEITAPPVPPLVGTEQIVIPFVVHNHRIGRGAVPPPFRKIGNGRVPIIDIDRVAVCPGRLATTYSAGK